MLAVFAGCDDSEGESTETTTAASSVETTAPATEYTSDTEIFATFEDMKANASLYKALAPCTRSTEGYYEKGDGGAATYSIVTKKPDGVFEKLADGLWACLVTEENVVPQQFGAYGDGKRNDHTAIMRAAEYAVANGVKLELPEADYFTLSSVVFENIEVISDNAKISYNGVAANTPTVELKNNVKIYGTLNLYLHDPKTSWTAERCAMLFGDYGSGVGAHNCYVESLVITGGMPGCNAVVMVGETSDITIDSIIIPNGTKYARGVCMHWGNGDDHKTVAGWSPELGEAGYSHAPDADPMTFVHDIKLGTVNVTGLKPWGLEDNDISAVALCAVYNVTIDEIIVNDSLHAAHITGADLGFEYASDEVKAVGGQKNIYIKKITGTKLRSMGLYIPGYPWYLPEKSVNTEIKVDELYLEAASSNTNSSGVYCNKVAKAEFGRVTLKGFSTAISKIECEDKVTVGTLTELD